MGTSIGNGDITFGDGTTQTTAYKGTNNTFGGVGSINLFWCTRTLNLVPGDTISGSYLFYLSQINSNIYANSSELASPGSKIILAGDRRDRTTAMSFSNAYTFSPIGGTWTVLTGCPQSWYDVDYAQTYLSAVLVTRIS